MRLVNLTPHPVVLQVGGEELVLPPSDRPARLQEKLSPVGELEGVPLFAVQLGDPIDLPAAVPGRLYVVSSIMRTALNSRFDLVSPCMFQRDSQGRIVAAEGLCGSSWVARWVET